MQRSSSSNDAVRAACCRHRCADAALRSRAIAVSGALAATALPRDEPPEPPRERSNPGVGREILAAVCTPITVTRNAEAPGTYEATGAVRFATVIANFSSGGRINTSFYAVSLAFSGFWLSSVGG
jgi:hypothetical protein